MTLRFKRIPDGFLGKPDILWVVQAPPNDITGTVHLRDQFSHPQGETCLLHISTLRRRGRLLPRQGGRSHLPTSHPIDGIVNEYYGDVLTATRSVHNLC